MGYCYNCGQSVTTQEAFCANCGAQLKEAISKPKNNTPNRIKRGYLFTNIEALSQKLSISTSWLNTRLLAFIEEKKAFGVNYILIDAANYTPKLGINKGKSKIKLTPSQGWETHQRLLADCYIYDTEHEHLDIDYLFIIGGHDIIPMPSVTNYIQNNDPTVDTDLPYGYLYGTQTQLLIETGELFHYQPMLHVGRLPLATDAVCNDLTNYLDRNLLVSKSGFPQTSFYAQSDPHWKKVSTLVTKSFLPEKDCVPDNLRDYVYKSIILTPPVTTGKEEYHPLLKQKILPLSHIFDESSVIYYFNMHGSNFPSSPYFVGEITPSTKKYLSGISPSDIQKATHPNIVVTEACYGARFIEATTENSMLLSAMQNLTMVYIGSSRTSLGQIDTIEDEQQYMSCADVIANRFLEAFLMGYDAAQSFFLGRRYVLLQAPNSAESYLTVVEFNLFGDPTLTFEGFTANAGKTTNKNSEFVSNSQTLVNKEDYCKTKISEINVTDSNSILDKVRQAVNRNVYDANQKINEHLYNRYGVKPRILSRVFEITNKHEKNRLYIYEKDDISQLWVTTDEKNQIKRVLTTK